MGRTRSERKRTYRLRRAAMAVFGLGVPALAGLEACAMHMGAPVPPGLLTAGRILMGAVAASGCVLGLEILRAMREAPEPAPEPSFRPMAVRRHAAPAAVRRVQEPEEDVPSPGF